MSSGETGNTLRLRDLILTLAQESGGEPREYEAGMIGPSLPPFIGTGVLIEACNLYQALSVYFDYVRKQSGYDFYQDLASVVDDCGDSELLQLLDAWVSKMKDYRTHIWVRPKVCPFTILRWEG